jgi:cell division septation protein DedD
MSLKTNPKILILTLLLVVLFALTAAGCGSKAEQASQEPEVLPTVQQPTATPIPPDRAVLIISPDDNAETATQAQNLMAELAASSGLKFETRQDITAETLSADIKVLVFLHHPDNLGTLAAGAAGTQFVAVSDLDWTPPANVTLIHEDTTGTAFLAGYIAAITAPNFRVGALLAAEDTQMNTAFKNGVNYYCGICSSAINPLNAYPVVAEQPTASTPETWQAAFDQINLSKVNVVYIAREAVSPQLLAYLSSQDVAIISNQPISEEGRSRWAASVYMDAITPLREIWGDLVAGTGGKTISATFQIGDTQEVTLTDGSVWLSPGKLILVNQMVDLMREGQIDTQSVN